MSATLAALIGVVAPQWSVTVFESAADVAGESSDGVEQRGHRARGALRAQLHARRPRRARGPLEGRHHQRAVPGVPPVLVAPGPRRHDRLAQELHHAGPPPELRDRRGRPVLHAHAARGARRAAAVRGPGVHRGRRAARGVAAADDGRPRSRPGRGRHPFGRGHRRELRRPHPADARRRRRPRRRRCTATSGCSAWRRTPTAGGSSRPGTRSPASSAPCARGSSSSAPAAAPCPCCSRPGSRRSAGSAASRSAASSCAPRRPSWSAPTRRRSTARPPSARRRCPSRIWTSA